MKGQTSSTSLLPTPCTMPSAIALNTASTVAQLNRLLRFDGASDLEVDDRCSAGSGGKGGNGSIEPSTTMPQNTLARSIALSGVAHKATMASLLRCTDSAIMK